MRQTVLSVGIKLEKEFNLKAALKKPSMAGNTWSGIHGNVKMNEAQGKPEDQDVFNTLVPSLSGQESTINTTHAFNGIILIFEDYGCRTNR